MKRLSFFCSFLAAAAMVAISPQAQAQVVDYLHPSFNCDWVKAEYDRVLAANKEGLEHETSTRLLVARILTAVMFGIEKITGTAHEDPQAASIGARIDFSGDVADIAAAARAKNCYDLYEQIRQAERAGELNGVRPAPVVSKLN